MIRFRFWASSLFIVGLALFVRCSNQPESPFDKEYELRDGESLPQVFERVKTELDTAGNLDVLTFSEWQVADGTQAMFFVLSDGYGIAPYLLIPSGDEGRYKLVKPELPEGSFFRDAYGTITFENSEAADMDGDGSNELKVKILSSTTGPAEDGDGMRFITTSYGEVLTYKNNTFSLDADLSEAYNRLLREAEMAYEEEAEEAARLAEERIQREMATLLSSYPATIESREQMKEILTRMGLASHDDGEESRLRIIGKDEVKGFYYNKCEDYGWNSIVTADSDAESDEGSEVYPVFTFSYQDTYNFKIVNMLNDGKNLSFGLEELDYNLQPVAEGSGLTRNSSEFIIYRVGKSWILEELSNSYSNYYTATAYLENIRQLEVECEEEEY